ncbi:ERAD-associated protein [Chytriomyces hyalinus]|nr:ERAD-associated protein [Chytriomyces hyalinus]
MKLPWTRAVLLCASIWVSVNAAEGSDVVGDRMVTQTDLHEKRNGQGETLYTLAQAVLSSLDTITTTTSNTETDMDTDDQSSFVQSVLAWFAGPSEPTTAPQKEPPRDWTPLLAHEDLLYAQAELGAPVLNPMLDTVAERREKAVALLDIAARKLNNRDAAMLLGDMYLHKRMFHQRNITRAIQYYSMLADTHGNATAQRVLGNLYAAGVGVKRDYSKALLYMSFAALGNDLLAHQTLGYWHSVGIATPKSCDDAIWHYKILADKVMETSRSGPPGGRTVPMGKIRLPDAHGGIFGPGASGAGSAIKNQHQSAESYRTVREILEISADEGDSSVQLELGSLYYSGTRYTQRNYKKAAKYFLQAAKAFTGKKPQGEMTPTVKHRVAVASLAAGFLGTMYWRGEGFTQDEATARQWFERGEALGNGMSLNGLGMMILRGAAGFEVDHKKALQYFTDAIQKDYSDAYVNLAELTLQTGKPDALATAFKYYTAAASKPPSSTITLYRLAEFHSQGLGNTPRNCPAALGYYKSMVERADWHDPQIRRAQEHFSRGEERDSATEMDSAFLLYLFAAERGHEVAQTNAAYMIDKGMVGGVGHARYLNATDESGVSKADLSDPIIGGELEIHANDMYELALVQWNRAANQGNVDARVKMGDYHYHGLGLTAFEALEEEAADAAAEGSGSALAPSKRKTRTVASSTGLEGVLQKLLHPYYSIHDAVISEPRFDKAALYYQVAADEASALAQWNVGYMHENGIGVAKDYPLAKRMYDMAFATNPESYLAVNLALAKLGLKMRVAEIVSTITHYTSKKFIREMLKKYHLFENMEDFSTAYLDENGDLAHNAKGSIPASADAHLEAIGGKPVKATAVGISVRDHLSGIKSDAVLVLGLATLMGVLFLWRQRIPIPTGPQILVPAVHPGVVAEVVPLAAEAPDAPAVPAGAGIEGLVPENAVNPVSIGNESGSSMESSSSSGADADRSQSNSTGS